MSSDSSSSPSASSSEDEEEFMDDDEAPPEEDEGSAETIERVLKFRLGVPGAVGPATTSYNVEEKGDPNAAAEISAMTSGFEKQYLIKWTGWSHLHNTWESDKSLGAAHIKGIKKLDNFDRKYHEMSQWREHADKDNIEFYDCEQEMNEEMIEEYTKVERVIAHQVSREKNARGERVMEYFIKWSCIPYAECTWEDEELIRRNYAHKIDEYFRRIDSKTLPTKNNPHLFTRKRPKFCKLDVMPDFLRRAENPDMELRDYQLEGLNWLLHAWSRENSCILADEMGLGKTIQTISFLSSLFHLHDVHGPFLVVVPLSTMTAWQREFEIWAPALNTIVYMGDVTSREQIRQFELLCPGSRKIKINVLLTTYEILLKDKAFWGGFDWAAIVVDEAHRLKNNDALLYICLKSFKTAHRLLITGTPLQNSLKELWALLHFIMPEKFSSWPEFEREHEDRDHRGLSALHKKLEPFLLRRVKKDVEKSLPAKVEQILRVDMTAKQKQYYKWILTKNYQELSKGVKGSINGFVNLVMELKKCCNHCTLVRQYDNVEMDAQGRLHQLLKSSGKLILLDKLLCRLKETGHRVLIFSQMVMMLDLLQEYMQLRRFNTQRLDGSMRADLRKQALDHFNAPGSTDFCFLLSTRAGGLGINLATADTVIIFDSDWNPQNDLQAMSRAHRIGQKKQVNIYRFVTKNSVEEEIVERAKKKLVLDHLVIQRMDTTGRTVLSKSAVNNPKLPFDKADLNAILKFGAEDLFKEKEGEEQEPEVDIDDILTRAETRECDNQMDDNELLSAFKYANFALDEEKDIGMIKNENPSPVNVGDGGRVEEPVEKEWNEIIPEEQLRKIQEEERRKAEEELNLGPRQRTKVHDTPPEHHSDLDSSDDERTGKRGPYKKKVLFAFTEAEIRRLAKSLKKFTHPLERLDAIAQDAELEDHSQSEIDEVVREVMRRMEEAAAEKEKPEEKREENGKKKPDRGPVVRIGNVDIYVRPIMKQQRDLEPLHVFVQKQQEAITSDFKLPQKPKEQVGWDVEWDVDDDVSLLRGVYRYGVGSWDAIKMDPDFGLADKIWIKDKVKKPQPKHLQSRTETLLKLLAKSMDPESFKRKSVKRVRTDNVSKKEDDETLAKKPKKERAKEKNALRGDKEHKNSHLKDEKHDKRDSRDLRSKLLRLKVKKDQFSDAIDNQASDEFKKCVELLRPVTKYIKKLAKEGEGDDAERQKSLNRLGDHITGVLETMEQGAREKWHSCLWIFVSKFITPSQDPEDLQAKYAVKAFSKNRDKDHSKHHHHHHETKKKNISPSKNDGARRSHHDHGHTRHKSDSHHHASQPSSSRYSLPNQRNHAVPQKPAAAVGLFSYESPLMQRKTVNHETSRREQSESLSTVKPKAPSRWGDPHPPPRRNFDPNTHLPPPPAPPGLLQSVNLAHYRVNHD